MKDTLVFLTSGFEELEAISVIDILRRAGMPVVTVSITNSLLVRGAHGVQITADTVFDPALAADTEWLILPGGMPGATNLYNFAPLHGAIRNQVESSGGRIAAICASPGEVLGKMGVLKGENFTCYPGFEGLAEGANHVPDRVVVSGKFVTANGPSSATLWALAIVRETLGNTVADEVAAGMLLYSKSANDSDFNFG